MKYMIELKKHPTEIYFYIEELREYGEIVLHNERYPTMLWLESEWEKDILEGVYGVEKVWKPKGAK